MEMIRRRGERRGHVGVWETAAAPDLHAGGMTQISWAGAWGQLGPQEERGLPLSCLCVGGWYSHLPQGTAWRGAPWPSPVFPLMENGAGGSSEEWQPLLGLAVERGRGAGGSGVSIPGQLEHTSPPGTEKLLIWSGLGACGGPWYTTTHPLRTACDMLPSLSLRRYFHLLNLCYMPGPVLSKL